MWRRRGQVNNVSPPASKLPETPHHEEESAILSGRQTEVPRVWVREIACAQEVENEPGRSIQQRDESQQPPLKRCTSVKHVNEDRDPGQDERIVESHVAIAHLRIDVDDLAGGQVPDYRIRGSSAGQ